MKRLLMALTMAVVVARAGSVAQARCSDFDHDGDCDLRRGEASKLANQLIIQFRRSHCDDGICVLRDGQFRDLRQAIADLLLEIDERNE